MKAGDVIILSNGEEATIISGDGSQYKNALIVELANHDVRVVDRKTLTLALSKPHDNLGSHKKIR